MFTTFDIVDKVYSVLHTAGITGIYKHAKPVNESQAEYIVINALSTGSEILQECPINVNYHCDDIDKHRRIADETKLNANAKAIIAVLDDYYDSEVDISLVFQTTIKDEEIPEHYENMRFIVRHVN